MSLVPLELIIKQQLHDVRKDAIDLENQLKSKQTQLYEAQQRHADDVKSKLEELISYAIKVAHCLSS